MPGTPGRKSNVTVSSTSGGTYTRVQGVKSASHTIDGATVDDSEMTVDWIQRIIGLKDGKLTLSGNRRLADTTGQNLILTQMMAGATVFVKVLPDNAVTANVGYQQEMLVSKFQEDDAVDGAVSWTCELEGNGPITLV